MGSDIYSSVATSSRGTPGAALSKKKIPKTNWSSPKPLNFKPKISTFLYLCLGLTFFGLGEGLLLVSSTGASPWSVLAQGISLNIDYSIGIITFFISFIKYKTWSSMIF